MEIEKTKNNNLNAIDSFLNRKEVFYTLFFVLTGLIILIRTQIYLNVNFDFVDSDQPFMWAGAADYAKGIFHEPRFYGQNYNTFFEGLIAVPFIWIGLPVYEALPIATHLLFLFPFIFSAFYFVFLGRKMNAIIVLSILICLPSGFDIMTSLPRGFVTGIFFSSFFVVSFHQPNNFKANALNFFMIVLGYFVNPNSILISLPFAIYIFQFNSKQKIFYGLLIGVLVLFVLLHYVFDVFYSRHPEYIIYGYEHNFSYQFFLQTIKHLDDTFSYLSFFVEGQSWIVILSCAILGFFLFKFNKRAFIAFVSFLCLLIIMFFSEKSRDGVIWPWYSLSRLYICLPAVLFLFTGIFHFEKNRFLIFLILMSISFSTFKLSRFQYELKRLTNQKLWNGVHLVSINNTLNAMTFYKKVCEENKVDFLLISNGFWLSTYLDYGGPAFDSKFPQTMETRAERRFWVREALNDKVFEKFIFISTLYNFEEKASGNFKIKKLDNYGLYLIENNKITTKNFIDIANRLELN